VPVAEKRSGAFRRPKQQASPWSFLAPVVKFVDSVLKVPDGRARRAKPRALPVAERAPAPPGLPCELFLTTGLRSIPLFPVGPIDEFRFFQRFGVALHSEVEFVTRLDAQDRGTENFRAFGLFDLGGDWLPLPDLGRDEDLKRTLARKYGLERLPAARKLAEEGFSGYDPRRNEVEAGLNRIVPPRSTKVFKKVDGRHWSYADILDILRSELTGPQRIAWIEEACPPPPESSPIVHRYYLDAKKQAYLVREQRGRGKRLFLALTSAEAIEAVLSSGKHIRHFRG
jgi:hypothetical protein